MRRTRGIGWEEDVGERIVLSAGGVGERERNALEREYAMRSGVNSVRGRRRERK